MVALSERGEASRRGKNGRHPRIEPRCSECRPLTVKRDAMATSRPPRASRYGGQASANTETQRTFAQTACTRTFTDINCAVVAFLKITRQPDPVSSSYGAEKTTVSFCALPVTNS
jgi:hypothetical protein